MFHFNKLAELNEFFVAVDHRLIPVDQLLEYLDFDLYLLIEIVFNCLTFFKRQYFCLIDHLFEIILALEWMCLSSSTYFETSFFQFALSFLR